MDFRSAQRAVLQLLGTTAPADVPALLHWMRTTRDFDEFTQDNNDIMLKNIADDLRNCLPVEAVLCSEHLALQKIRQQPEPTVHVDAFLYDEDFIDTLCEEGKMSRKNRKEPEVLQYIFKLLDIENKGYLNVFSLNYFFRAIQELMKIHGQDPVSFQDVKDEIFDMVKPKDPLKISLQDLINSNQGDTVTTILIDLNGFWTYENREALVANDNENSADLDYT